jgi:arylsulfatase A-like enzyme
VPGIDTGREVQSIVNLVDVMPTVLDLMGIEKPDRLQGRSFVSLLEGREAPDRPVIAETRIPNRSNRLCLIHEGWKYIQGDTDPGLLFPAASPEHLFRLDDDPLERGDLKDAHPDMLRKLSDTIERTEKEFNAFREDLGLTGEGEEGISKELRERLKQQGYL